MPNTNSGARSVSAARSYLASLTVTTEHSRTGYSRKNALSSVLNGC
ncbi:hypothetical protein KN815_34540 [Streptomyces sp. 4503]|uniref:Uncharacterized protein n=1 Tax=Streptomyces niphimycinicus TaxID=2842201 RepID=A0ABS6CPW8_9ACTN|nr:hypothetical protein [Streptomyces niphimycinicus]MBU3868991.1 hypothetical protein [Streptomyces niphimycinicus]